MLTGGKLASFHFCLKDSLVGKFQINWIWVLALTLCDPGLLLLLLVKKQDQLYGPGWPEIHCVTQVGLELTVSFLFELPKYWDYRCEAPYPGKPNFGNCWSWNHQCLLKAWSTAGKQWKLYLGVVQAKEDKSRGCSLEINIGTLPSSLLVSWTSQGVTSVHDPYHRPKGMMTTDHILRS